MHLAFEAQVAYGLADLVLLEGTDYLAAGKECNEHTYNHGQHCPERKVMHQSHSGKVNSEALKPVYKVVEHCAKISLTISFSSK